MAIRDQLTTTETINATPWFYEVEPGTREIVFVIKFSPWRFMPPVGFVGKISLMDRAMNNATFEVNSDGSGGNDNQTYIVPDPPTVPVVNTPGYLRELNLIQASPGSPLANATLLNLPPGTVRYSGEPLPLESLNYFWTLTNIVASEANPITMILDGVGG